MSGSYQDSEGENLQARIADARAHFPDIGSMGGEIDLTPGEIEQAIAAALPDRSQATHGNCARFAVALNAAAGGPGHYALASAGEFGANHVAVILGGRMYDGSGHLTADEMVERYIEIDRDLETDEAGGPPSFEEWARLRLCDFVAIHDPEGQEVSNWGDTDGNPPAFDIDEMADRLRDTLAAARQPRLP